MGFWVITDVSGEPSAPKFKAAVSSEIVIAFYQSTRRHIREKCRMYKYLNDSTVSQHRGSQPKQNNQNPFTDRRVITYEKNKDVQSKGKNLSRDPARITWCVYNSFKCTDGDFLSIGLNWERGYRDCILAGN